MKNYFLAERLKYRHTSLNAITILMPLITVFLAAWLTHHYFAVDSYNWWYVGLYAGYLGIICSIIGNKDRKKKNHTIGSLPCSMGQIWNAKILVGVIMSGVSVIFVVGLTILMGKAMELFLHMQFIGAPSVSAQLLAGIVMWLTTLWQLPFCLFLVQKTGTFLMLAIHMVLYCIFTFIFSVTSLFPLFPGAITSRVMCPILEVMPNGLLLQPNHMGYSPALEGMGNLLIGIPAALLWFALFWWLGKKWFERQVASK